MEYESRAAGLDDQRTRLVGVDLGFEAAIMTAVAAFVANVFMSVQPQPKC